jgi:hypothetical protein
MRPTSRPPHGVLNERVVPALGMPGSYTARGRQFDSVVKYLMGADQAGNDLPMRLRGRYLLIYRGRDLENEPNPGLRAASTTHIRYRIDPGLGLGEDELNARLRRTHRMDGRAIAEREPRVRGTDGPAHGAAPHAARDRRRVGAAEPRAVVPAPARSPPGPITGWCSRSCARLVIVASTARRRRGSSAACDRRARTCSRRICHASGSSGRLSLYPDDPLFKRRTQ